MLERSRVLAPAYSLPLIVRMFTLHQSVAQNLSDMRLSTFEIGEVLLRSGSVTEISEKSLFLLYVWTDALSGMVFVPAQELSGICNNRELKERRFWATPVNRKWGLFHFKAPWRSQICISKCLNYYRDKLSQKMGKITVEKWKKTLPIDVRRWKTSLLYKFTNYSPKRRWLVVLFTESAQRRGQYPPPLATLRWMIVLVYTKTVR